MPPKKDSAETTHNDKIKHLRLSSYSKLFMAEYVRALICIYAIGRIKDAGAIDLIYDIMFIDPVTTRYFAKFQEM